MRYSTIATAAVCVVLFATRVPAADLPNGALCALAEIVECGSGAACEKVSADEIGVPRFIQVELAQRTLRGVGPRARDRVTTIRSVDRRGDVIFAQGVDDEIQGERSAFGWILALSAVDGTLRLTVTGEDITFVATGECLINQ